jgi:hypothetical protein
MYANRKFREVEFKEGDKVFLKIAPMKGVMRFGKKEKLSPKYIGHFDVLQKIGATAYQVALPPSLSAIHNVFHVLMLRKCVSDASYVLEVESLQVCEDLSYKEFLVGILAQKE